MSELSPSLTQLLYAVQNELLDDPLGRATEKSFRFGVAGEFEHALLAERINRHKVSTAFSPPPPFQTARMGEGNFIQGTTLAGEHIRYSHLIRQEPSILIGCTGSGKTNLFRFEALQWGQLTKGLWLVDLRKNDFAAMRPHFQRVGVDLQVVPARKLKINLCQIPEGVDATSFASALSDSLTAVLDLPPVAGRVLFQNLILLYQQRGVLNGSRDYPTVFELLDAVQRHQQAHKAARDAIVVRLETLLLSIGSVLCYRQGWTHRDFATRKIVFSLNGLGQVDQDVLLNWLLLSEFQSRIASGKSNRQIELKVIVDEASRLVRNNNTSIGSLISVVRGSGIGLTLGNQDADLARSIISNSPNKFLARCSNAADYSAMGAAMGLSAEQVRFFQQNVQPGVFCCVLGQGTWRKPFLFRVPLLKFNDSAQIAQHSPELDALPVVKADKFSDWQPDWLKDTPNRVTAGKSLAVSESDSSAEALDDEGWLTADEETFLRAVVAAPCQPVSYYPAVVRFSKRKCLQIRSALVSKKLLAEQTTQTSGRGRPSILLAATPRGEQVINELEST